MQYVYIFLFSLCSTFFLSCSKEKEILQADDCGKHLFSVLQNIDSFDKNEFEENFISLETIHRIGNDGKSFRTKKRRDRYANMTRKEYMDDIIDAAFDLVIGEGGAYDIDWDDIKYVAFGHQEQDFSNLESIKGKLVFEYNKKKYAVSCIYVKYDNKWQLSAIVSLYMEGIHNPYKTKDPTLFEI